MDSEHLISSGSCWLMMWTERNHAGLSLEDLHHHHMLCLTLLNKFTGSHTVWEVFLKEGWLSLKLTFNHILFHLNPVWFMAGLQLDVDTISSIKHEHQESWTSLVLSHAIWAPQSRMAECLVVTLLLWHLLQKNLDVPSVEMIHFWTLISFLEFISGPPTTRWVSKVKLLVSPV